MYYRLDYIKFHWFIIKNKKKKEKLINYID